MEYLIKAVCSNIYIIEVQSIGKMQGANTEGRIVLSPAEPLQEAKQCHLNSTIQ